jgi:hypothetical protein
MSAARIAAARLAPMVRLPDLRNSLAISSMQRLGMPQAEAIHAGV